MVKRRVWSCFKANWLYITLFLFGVALLLIAWPVNSNIILSSSATNVLMGLGTGTMTSALISRLIEWKNTSAQKKKDAQQKKQLLYPLCNKLYYHLQAYNNKTLIQTLLADENIFSSQSKASPLEAISSTCLHTQQIGSLFFEYDELRLLQDLCAQADVLLPFCRTRFQGLQVWGDTLMNDRLFESPIENIAAYEQEQAPCDQLDAAAKADLLHFSSACKAYIATVTDIIDQHERKPI